MNAKELALSKINATVITSGMWVTGTIYGIPVEKLAAMTNDPFFKEVLKEIDKSPYEVEDFAGLEQQLMKSSNATQLENHVTLVQAADEIKKLGKALGLNQGLAPTDYDMYMYKISLQNYVNDRFKEFKPKDFVDNPLIPSSLKDLAQRMVKTPFNLTEFINKPEYREVWIALYSTVARTTNILNVLNQEHILAQLRVYQTSYEIQGLLSPKYEFNGMLVELLNLKDKEGKKVFIKTKKEDVALDEIQFKRLSNFYDDVMVHLFYNQSNNRLVRYDGIAYDLSDSTQRLQFKKAMDTKGFLQMTETYPNNDFTKGFTADNKTNELGEYETFYKQRKSFEQTDSMSKASAGFDRIKSDVMNRKKNDNEQDDSTNEELIRHYNLIVSKDAVSKKNFTKYFEFKALQSFIDFQNQFKNVEGIAKYLQDNEFGGIDLHKFLTGKLAYADSLDFMTKVLISSKIKALTYQTKFDDKTKGMTYIYNNETFIPYYHGYTKDTMEGIAKHKTADKDEVDKINALNQANYKKQQFINNILNNLTDC